MFVILYKARKTLVCSVVCVCLLQTTTNFLPKFFANFAVLLLQKLPCEHRYFPSLDSHARMCSKQKDTLRKCSNFMFEKQTKVLQQYQSFSNVGNSQSNDALPQCSLCTRRKYVEMPSLLRKSAVNRKMITCRYYIAVLSMYVNKGSLTYIPPAKKI